jgi:hypothetical protein
MSKSPQHTAIALTLPGNSYHLAQKALCLGVPSPFTCSPRPHHSDLHPAPLPHGGLPGPHHKPREAPCSVP